MVDAAEYLRLKQAIIEAGYADDIDWSDNIRPCGAPCHFIREYIFVVVNSGMKAQIATRIFWDIMYVVAQGRHSIISAFRHPGKVEAIERALEEGVDWWNAYQAADDKLTYLEQLPWIGGVTKYHLGKNLGLPVAKPDRHLVRIAGSAEAVQLMCEGLACKTGDSVQTVDTVLWRAANLGMI